MTIRETAVVLGLKVRTVREWIKKEKLVAVKNGKCWDISEKSVFSEEVQKRANKGREHSRRIEEGRSMGMLARGSQDTQKSVQRTKRKK